MLMVFARELIFHGADIAQSLSPLGCLLDEPLSITRRADFEIPLLSHRKIQRCPAANVAGLFLFLDIVVIHLAAPIAAGLESVIAENHFGRHKKMCSLILQYHLK